MQKPYLLVLLFLFAISSFAQERGARTIDADTSKQTKEQAFIYENKYALVVGVDRYKDKRIPSLRYATNDAKAIMEVLTGKLGFPFKNVELLLDSTATRDKILRVLQQFVTNDSIPENSQLFVYFAGHGTTVGSKSSSLGFLMPYDAEDGSQFATAIDMDRIRSIASSIRSKHVLFVVDACYGGLAGMRATSNNKAVNAFMRSIWNRKGREIITAGSADETVLEADDWQHSAFTKVLLDAIVKEEADANQDKIIITSELFSYMQQRVPYYAQIKGGKQTPQFSPLTPDGGTFLLELEPNAFSKSSGKSVVYTDDVEEIAKKFNTKLVITSNADNARVYIDNKEIGYLKNNKLEYGITPGLYKITLKKDKFEAITKDIEVRPDSVVSYGFLMESKMATVEFKISPADAVVTIGNDILGTGSFKTELPKGRISMMVESKGYKSEATILNLSQDGTVVSVNLEKILATVEVNSVPLGSLIVIDGDTIGKTPKTFSLGYGSHTVFLHLDGFRPHRIPLQINESSLITQNVIMKVLPQVIAKRNHKKFISKKISNFALNAVFAGAGYLGYQYCQEKLKTADSNEKDMYKAGGYASAGVGAIFAISGVSSLFKILGNSYKKELQKVLEEESKQSAFRIEPHGLGLKLAYTFK